jgi:hypothetical protein
MAGRALRIRSIRTDLPVNATRDTSDGAFVRLAPSTVHQLSGDAQVPDRTESLLAFFNRDLRSSPGGFIEGIPATMPCRQNPQLYRYYFAPSRFGWLVRSMGGGTIN